MRAMPRTCPSMRAKRSRSWSLVAVYPRACAIASSSPSNLLTSIPLRGTTTDTPLRYRRPTMHGHHDHAAMFRRRFWLSLVLTVPVVVYSHMLMTLTGWTPPAFSGDHWVGPVLGTLTFLY